MFSGTAQVQYSRPTVLSQAAEPFADQPKGIDNKPQHTHHNRQDAPLSRLCEDAMTAKDFLKAVAKGRQDVVQILLNVLGRADANYCVIGDLAVNAYAEPVVSLDIDVVVAVDHIDKVAEAAAARGLRVERFEHSVNLTAAGSDLRVQLQTDKRYQAFIPRAAPREVLGYRMNVAAVEDVLQGKVWAWQDGQRRRSKRQKDLADIMRLIESNPALESRLPPDVRAHLR